MGFWIRAVPLIGTIGLIAMSLWRYAARDTAENLAIALLRDTHAAQEAFRVGDGQGAYASDLVSLTAPCPGHSRGALAESRVRRVMTAGFDVYVRPAESAEVRGPDCHGRPTVLNYYAAVQPHSPRTAAQHAFASTAAGRVFVFFDGVAPLERDMGPGGLATPLEALGAFRIP